MPDFVVIIPKTGKRISLIESSMRLAGLTAWAGLTRKEQDERFRALDTAFHKLKDAIDSNAHGEPVESIAKRMNKHPDTVTNWLKGKGLPEGLVTEVAEARIRKHRPLTNLADILKSPQKMEDAGYLIGACLGNVSVARDKHGHSMAATTVSSKGFAESIVTASNRTLNTNIAARNALTNAGNMAYATRIGNLDFIQFFNKITSFGKRVPTEFLAKRTPVRIGFLKGIIDSHAGTMRGCIIIRVRDNQLRGYIKNALAEIGIPSVEGDISLRINKPALRTFKERIGFRDEKKAAALENMTR